MNKILVTTLSLNRQPFTKRFLETFFDGTNEPVDMVIVEQGSGDPAKKLCQTVDGKITKNGSTIKVVWNEQNVGIPIALNQALALRDPSQHFMKIDNDVYFPNDYKEWLTHLIDITENCKDKDAFGILGLCPFDINRPQSEKGNVKVITLKNGHQYQIEQSPHNLMEMGLFLSSRVVNQVGLFNARGLKYGYEGAWYQAKAIGFNKAYYETCKAVHGDTCDLLESTPHRDLKNALLAGSNDTKTNTDQFSNDESELKIEWL